MTDARSRILQRVRSALRDVPKSEALAEMALTRDYRTTSDLPQAELVELFARRVAEYKATVRQVAAAELPDAIAAACATRGLRHLAAPADIPREWLPAGLEARLDDGLSHAQLDATDGVLTGCALGIAQTGTIVLDGGPRQGRRVITLLPDYHLCVVYAGQVVGLVPEAVAALASSVDELHRPLTFISGPSATSDIELNRVEGVHGPRTLEVLIVLSSEF